MNPSENPPPSFSANVGLPLGQVADSSSSGRAPPSEGGSGADTFPRKVEVNTEEAAPDKSRSDARGLSAWKEDLRQDFETWLATVEEIPPTSSAFASEDEEEEDPDLYSFYAQFAAANLEARKANRRTAEAMSQWGQTLARFEAGLEPLRQSAEQLAATQPVEGRISRAHCLILIELLDRMHRLSRAFESPPASKPGWWGRSSSRDDAWPSAWQSQHQGLKILISHLEGWLKKEGIDRLVSTARPFDPSVMVAVAVEAASIASASSTQVVLEELAAGYTRDGELLRAAQVKVSSQL